MLRGARHGIRLMGSVRWMSSKEVGTVEEGVEMGTGKRIFRKERTDDLRPPKYSEDLEKDEVLPNIFSTIKSLNANDHFPELKEKMNKYIELMEEGEKRPRDEESSNELAYERQTITAYSELGFTVNEMEFKQSIIVYPYDCFLWSVECLEDLTVDSIRMLEIFQPRPGLLIIGSNEIERGIDFEVIKYLRSIGVGLEKMSLTSAVNTFNIMAQDGRDACCALIIRGNYESNIAAQYMTAADSKNKSILEHRQPADEIKSVLLK